MVQAVAKLLNNADKYAPDRPDIEIHAEGDGKIWR